jgi:hypothetical protein
VHSSHAMARTALGTSLQSMHSSLCEFDDIDINSQPAVSRANSRVSVTDVESGASSRAQRRRRRLQLFSSAGSMAGEEGRGPSRVFPVEEDENSPNIFSDANTPFAPSLIDFLEDFLSQRAKLPSHLQSEFDARWG